MLKDPYDLVIGLVDLLDRISSHDLTPEQLRDRSALRRERTSPWGNPFGDGYVILDPDEPPRRNLLDAILDGHDGKGD